MLDMIPAMHIELHLIKAFFGITGAVLLAGSVLPYALAMYRGKIKPHCFTWLLWGLINAIVCAAQMQSSAGAGAWTSGATAIVNTVIGIFAAFYGTRDITRGDWAILLSALSAMPLWWLTDDPLWSVVLLSLIDALAFWPTYRKSWNRPWEEAALPFVIGGLGFTCALIALDTYSLVNVLYGATVLATNAVFITMLLMRRRALLPRVAV